MADSLSYDITSYFPLWLLDSKSSEQLSLCEWILEIVIHFNFNFWTHIWWRGRFASSRCGAPCREMANFRP